MVELNGFLDVEFLIVVCFDVACYVDDVVVDVVVGDDVG